MRTQEQQQHLKELYQEIDNAPKLGRCVYYDAMEDCYCAVGHMAKNTSVINTFTKNNDNNGRLISHYDKDITFPIEEYYGINFSHIDRIQELNDHGVNLEDEDDEEIDSSLDYGDKESVLTYLMKLIAEGGG